MREHQSSLYFRAFFFLINSNGQNLNPFNQKNLTNLKNTDEKKSNYLFHRTVLKRNRASSVCVRCVCINRTTSTVLTLGSHTGKFRLLSSGCFSNTGFGHSLQERHQPQVIQSHTAIMRNRREQQLKQQKSIHSHHLEKTRKNLCTSVAATALGQSWQVRATSIAHDTPPRKPSMLEQIPRPTTTEEKTKSQ